ncbi:MAG: hypothetical protein HY775_11235 [Acidobacteria bacterium]|nr:hypothetical protein [Acidobacteriota bacterium]
MRRRWAVCLGLVLVLAGAPPSEAAVRRHSAPAPLWWSGTVQGPGRVKMFMETLAPGRTDVCLMFERGVDGLLGAYWPSIQPHAPTVEGVQAEWPAGTHRVLVWCAADAPSRVTVEWEGRVRGARWGRTGITLAREWDLRGTAVRGTLPVRFRRGATAWMRSEAGVLSLRGQLYSDHLEVVQGAPGEYVFGLEAGAPPLIFSSVDAAW